MSSQESQETLLPLPPTQKMTQRWNFSPLSPLSLIQADQLVTIFNGKICFVLSMIKAPKMLRSAFVCYR